MNRKKIVIFIIVVGIVSAVIYGWQQYNKKHPEYETLKIDVSVQAKKLYNDYKADQGEANNNYLGKVTEISGEVNQVEQLDSVIIISFVYEEGMFGSQGVRCAMIPEQQINPNEISIGMPIKLKGICKGFNDTDVILEKCSISNTN